MCWGSSLGYICIFKNRKRSHALVVRGQFIRNEFQEPRLSVTEADLDLNLTPTLLTNGNNVIWRHGFTQIS